MFQRTPLDFVGNTSFIQYTNGSGRFEIDAMRTRDGTTPANSQWTKNPIPCVGTGPGDPINGTGTQFPLPTLHGRTVNTPSRLAGFVATPGTASGNNVGFNDWVLVDKLRVPADLPVGDYVLSFRWGECLVCCLFRDRLI